MARWRVLALTGQSALLLVAVTGLLARAIAVPGYTPDSGDEWGNTIAPLRLLLEGGNPGVFLHPSLYYYVTAAVYAVVFSALRVLGIVPGSLTITDVFVLDPRYFIFAARAVSVMSAALAMWALYALGTRLWRRTAGLMAAALLAVLPLHAVYSDAVRVDGFFLAVFLCAFYRIVCVLGDPERRSSAIAGVLTGLAVGANYNGVVLVPWLVGAHLLRGPRTLRGNLARALGLAVVAFLASSPFVFLDLATSIKNLTFISSLSLVEHPGMEGRGVLFYAEDLVRANPYLAAAIATSIIAVALCGNRAERFTLSLPVGYFVLFSLVRTKFDRFILPAMALFLLVASGLPFVLARRFGARRIAEAVSSTLSYALLVLCLASMATQSLPVPRHDMLPRPDALLLDWIERNVPPRSNILVESGILPLIDALEEPGRLAARLRQAIAGVRPNLDHHYIGAVYVGGRSNYEPGILVAKRIDYAIISPRNTRYIESHCELFPSVCAFYRDLRASGRVVFQTPDGVEPALVYEVRRP